MFITDISGLVRIAGSRELSSGIAIISIGEFMLRLILWVGLWLVAAPSLSHSIVETVTKIKPSVVGVGVYDPLGAPRANLQGTGFVIGDGTLVATNYHVVAKELDTNSRQKRVVFVGSGNTPKTVQAEVLEFDATHDLALLKLSEKLVPMTLAENEVVQDGTEVAFTGFPIGSVLGLYPATHKGIIAAYTPVVIPSSNATQLNIQALKRLREPYFVYQMDATAYPGNSGSPVYELGSGKVVAVINKVFVKQTKEAVLSDPSGITYSIPVKYLRELMEKAGIEAL